MLINAVECKECGDIVYSRTEDDLRKCSCGRVEVTGGHAFFKHYAVPQTEYEVKKINLKVTLEQLYEDWDIMGEKFGLISCEESKQESLS